MTAGTSRPVRLTDRRLASISAHPGSSLVFRRSTKPTGGVASLPHLED